ncbi:hypothetical protein B5F10_13365 [Anaerotruncus colihominis]|uniref:Uncharacterized protein n=1 Tax=Anaerotruncus colihominis TaxID=169435 RepID=A0A1Y4MNP0_9FIRM|nr:hypothetical protein B5F11_13615 [Anaerotruncus colihominis]OUP72827.1 hypothetical protein B5F10_13365 [Anaerotruncus colihominis]
MPNRHGADLFCLPECFRTCTHSRRRTAHLSAADISPPAAQPVKVPEPAPLFAAQPVKVPEPAPLFAAQPTKVFCRGLFSKRPESFLAYLFFKKGKVQKSGGWSGRQTSVTHLSGF